MRIRNEQPMFNFKQLYYLLTVLCVALVVVIYYFLTPNKNHLGTRLPEVLNSISEFSLGVGELKGLFLQDTTKQIITISVIFKGGSALDPIGEEGISDIFSQMMLRGAGGMLAQEFHKMLDEFSIRVNTNATRDTLEINITSLSFYRKKAFLVLDLILNELSFKSQELELVKSSQLNKLQFAEQNPNYMAKQAVLVAIFPKNNLFRASIGTKKSIKNLQVKNLVAFKNTLLNKNVYVGVSGDINKYELEQEIRKIFLKFNKQTKTLTLPTKTNPNITNEVIHIHNNNFTQTKIYFIYPMPELTSIEGQSFMLITTLLAGWGLNSILMEKIRKEKGLVYNISGSTFVSEYGNFWQVTANTRDDNTKEVMATFRNVMDKVQRKQIDFTKIADTKAWLITQYLSQFQSIQSSAFTLAKLQVLGFNLQNIIQRYEATVSRADVEQIIDKYLSKGFLTIIISNVKSKINDAQINK